VKKRKGVSCGQLSGGNMLDSSWPGWGLMQSAITGATGLLGVLVGALATFHGQKKTRRHEHIKQQLAEFYSPLLSIHHEIRAKSEVRLKVHSLANAAFSEELSSSRGMLPEVKEKYDNVLKYSNEQLKQDLIPQYERMVKLYLEKRWLAEPSTLKFDYDLVEYIELWNRFFQASLPHRVLTKLDHSEERLKIFYQDLQVCFDKLSKELKE